MSVLSDLYGLVDPDLHTACDRLPRLLDDISAARQAAEAKMAGILIKSHTTTADPAAIAARIVPATCRCGG